MSMPKEFTMKETVNLMKLREHLPSTWSNIQIVLGYTSFKEQRGEDACNSMMNYILETEEETTDYEDKITSFIVVCLNSQELVNV
jgi:hypothetical protein